MIVRELRVAAESQFGRLGKTVVVGRPAHFSGAKEENDDSFALNRLRSAIEAASFNKLRLSSSRWRLHISIRGSLTMRN